MKKEICKEICHNDSPECQVKGGLMTCTDCCCECLIEHGGEVTHATGIGCQAWDTDRLFKFILLKHKYKKAEEKKMSNCPSCGKPITHMEYNKYLEREAYYCPCGWTEEDGENYIPCVKEGIQLRLEGM